MTDLKRLEVKYLRDRAKAAYVKDTECYICGSEKELEFHHFYSMTPLWERWKKDNGIRIKEVEDILAVRDKFIEDNRDKIYNKTVTLCKFHHKDRLHKIYSKSPTLTTALKQMAWCKKRRDLEYK